MQDHGAGWQPVHFASRTFTPAEKRYHTSERELRALVWATTEVFRKYIFGTEYLIQGDHRALATLLGGRGLTDRQYRWVEKLQEHAVPEMVFVKGSTLVVPDALSRHANGEEEDTSKDADPNVSEQLRELPDVPSAPCRTLRVPPRLQNCPLITANDSEGHLNTLASLEGAEPTRIHVEEEEDQRAKTTAALAAAAANVEDTQDWKFNEKEFERWQKATGTFDVDAFCDERGVNKQQVPAFWSNALKQKWHGKHVWANVQFTSAATPVADVLDHVARTRRKCNSMSVVMVLPYFPGAAWEEKLANMPNKTCLFTYLAGTRLFTSAAGKTPETQWPVQIWLFRRMDGRRARDTAQYATATLAGANGRSSLPRKAKTAAAEKKAEEKEASRRAESGRRAVPPTQQRAQPPAESPSTPLEPSADKEVDGGERQPAFIERVRDAAQKDVEYQKMLKAAEHERQCWQAQGGLLFRKAGPYAQLWLPKSRELRQAAMASSHDTPMAGHFGQQKTLARLKTRFWWENLEDDVRDYCSTCEECQRAKPVTQRKATSYHALRTPARRWAEIQLDFVGPLPMTERWHDAVMTVTDRSSKMVHLIPLGFQGSDAAVVARLLRDHVWKHHGMPTRIISDRDVRFTSKLWTELCELLHIDREMTTAYHPQANGGAERTNQTMEVFLRIFADKFGKAGQADWDDCLSMAEYAINYSVSASTKQTPFVLNHGESPNTVVDYYLQEAAGIKPLRVESAEFCKQWRDALSAAKQSWAEAQKRYEKVYNSKFASPANFKVGDKVALNLAHITMTAQKDVTPKFRDLAYPYTVTEVVARDDGQPVNYRLDLPPNMRHCNVFHESQLRPWRERDAKRWPLKGVSRPAPELTAKGEEVYEVEAIARHRGHGPKTQYFVIWRGYPYSEGTWETADSFVKGNTVLDKYIASVKRSEAQLLEKLSRKRQASVSALLSKASEALTRPLRILVLCCGTKSVEKQAHISFANVECTSVDVAARFEPTHCMTVEQFVSEVMPRYGPNYFDVVWCSPPCTEYSRAKTVGTRDLLKADATVHACLETIAYLRPTYWFVENPRGLLQHRELMKALEPFREKTTYCKYGTFYQKPTNIWSNTKGVPPALLECKYQDRCELYNHEEACHLRTAQAAGRPGQPGMGSGVNVYPIPGALVSALLQRMHPTHIALACPRARPWGKDQEGGSMSYG